MIRLIFAVAVALTATACVNLDGFVWNPRHCTLVDKKSTDCTESHVCSSCDEFYDFASFGIPSDAIRARPVVIQGDQTLDTYFIRADASSPRADTVVVYAHGNFGSLEHYLNRVGLLYAMGVNVYAVDYRGFGKSSTSEEPSDEALFDDDEDRTRDVLDTLLPAGVTRIFYYGYSAGALAAVEMALHKPPCGLILEAPWPSVQSFSNDSSFVAIPQPFIASSSWDNIARMPQIHAPLLQMHGTADDFVRFEVGQQVFDAANEPKTLIPVHGAGHGNGGDDVPTVLGPAYTDDVTGFLDAQVCD